MNSQIRLAKHADSQAIVALVNKAFAIESTFKKAERTDLDDIHRLMNEGQFFVLEDGGTFRDCVYTKIRPDRGYIGLLSVDPDSQGTGLGSRLMDFAESHCRENGCMFADLRIVHLRTELLGYYGKRGYETKGTAPADMIKGTTQPVHFILMAKPLDGSKDETA